MIAASIDGIGSTVKFNYPIGIAINPIMSTIVYVTDSRSNLLRQVNVTNQSYPIVTTLTNLQGQTDSIIINAFGTALFAAIPSLHIILQINLTDFSYFTLCGSGK